MSDLAVTLATVGDGFEWIDGQLGRSGFWLKMLKGAGVREMAEMLAAEPGSEIIEPHLFNQVLRSTSSELPDYAQIGECGGWAFALLSGGDGFHTHHPDRVRHLWEGRTWLEILDSTMDPPTVSVIVEGRLDWNYFWGEVGDSVRPDHPLTQRMRDEIGLGSLDPDEDPEEEALFIPEMAAVYRLMGEYYGLDLPRQQIVDGDLVGVFTSPRVYASGERNRRYDNIRVP